MTIKEWLIKWFIDNTDALEKEIRGNLDANYFAEGWIDSLKFIDFISDIEAGFQITFLNDEFQDRSFSTINGITRIIERKIA